MFTTVKADFRLLTELTDRLLLYAGHFATVAIIQRWPPYMSCESLALRDYFPLATCKFSQQSARFICALEESVRTRVTKLLIHSEIG